MPRPEPTPDGSLIALQVQAVRVFAAKLEEKRAKEDAERAATRETNSPAISEPHSILIEKRENIRGNLSAICWMNYLPSDV